MQKDKDKDTSVDQLIPIGSRPTFVQNIYQ